MTHETAARKQLNVRIAAPLATALETLAVQEERPLRALVEEALAMAVTARQQDTLAQGAASAQTQALLQAVAATLDAHLSTWQQTCHTELRALLRDVRAETTQDLLAALDELLTAAFASPELRLQALLVQVWREVETTKRLLYYVVAHSVDEAELADAYRHIETRAAAAVTPEALFAQVRAAQSHREVSA